MVTCCSITVESRVDRMYRRQQRQAAGRVYHSETASMWKSEKACGTKRPQPLVRFACGRRRCALSSQAPPACLPLTPLILPP